jgi:hypothetical protein
MLLLVSCSQKKVSLGDLQSGSNVSFVPDTSGSWGIEITGNTVPVLINRQPAQIEIFESEENVTRITAGYQSVKKKGGVLTAVAHLTGTNGAEFEVEDSGVFQVMYCRSKESVSYRK